ncbi:MAG: polysaccharide deacetylase family protein [Candidatus Cloacimonadaceae bacterium]|jgi:peptidoglycan/xylan/chitin deacetylase (PgdA/CDA1 family)|nr:polysaccharide deacetylase family protein [Candidatus Cloacimonadota bacterium]MDY0326118.1 polysaccharide deacetylase family protein [Candidatus Cloacimonadaceae bacterium]
MNSIALSFDIEDWYHTASIAGSSFSLFPDLNDFLTVHKDNYIDCITSETARILEILASLNLRATFFVVADVANRYPEITEMLMNSNHEIASHSLTHHSAISSDTKQPLKPIEVWIDDQKKAKKLLEGMFNREVVGFRAPNAYFANWMVKPLAEIGFKYDSSIAYNSFYNKTNVRLPRIPSTPYLLNSHTLGPEEADTDLVELPWSYLNILDYKFLPAGGAYFFRLLGFNYFKAVLKQTMKKGDTMFYLHPLDISQKKIPQSNTKNRPAFWINKGLKTELRLIKLLKYYRDHFAPCIDVYEKYRQNAE